MAVGNTVSLDCCGCSNSVLTKLSESHTAAAPHIACFACQPTILLFLVSSLSFLLLVFAISCASKHYPLPSFPTDFSFSPPILPILCLT